MKFSTRTLYGLRAVFVLAARYGEGSLSVSQIARRENISVAYLEQILNALKKKGLVKSVRGPQGGYVLSKKPSDTSLKELLESVGGGLPEKLRTPRTDGDESKAADALFWKRLKNSVDEGLSSMSLKELVDQARHSKKGKAPAPAPFHI